MGKTVLLNQTDVLAREFGYHTMSLEAYEDKPLAALLVPDLRRLLYDLDRMAGADAAVKRGLAVLRSFVSGIKVTVGDTTFGLDIEPAVGSADSGDLETDLPNLFVAIGEAAAARHAAVALMLDEIQYFSAKELAGLIMAMHRVQQRQLPIVLIAAGLPILPALVGEAKSYAERLFAFPPIGALSAEDAAKALQEPAQKEGVSFTPEALGEIYRLTQGYPYFLQEWGYQAWNTAEHGPINSGVIQIATTTVTLRLDQNFFRVRFDRLTPSEKTFLRSMAELGGGPQRTSDVAALRSVNVTSLGPVRAKLLKKGVIYSPSYGTLAFSVPLFDAFLRRTIPDFEA